MNAEEPYRAVQAIKPGHLELTRKPLQNPGSGQGRIRVKGCGVCHSDAGTVGGAFPIAWPRVPGHEAVGRIDALGPGVQGWKASTVDQASASNLDLLVRA
jgi:alcohol dehydrogenase, propanol-preferring